jgi:excisionase family DNA binding protein
MTAASTRRKMGVPAEISDQVNGTDEVGPPSALLTADEVAALLRVRTGWVYAQTRANRIPHVRLGRYVRFRQDAIEQWIARIEAEGDGRAEQWRSRFRRGYQRIPRDSELAGKPSNSLD